MKKSNFFKFVGLGGTLAAYLFHEKEKKKELQKISESEKKMIQYYRFLNRWLVLKQKGNSIIDFFLENNYKSIAIYGYAEFGQRLHDELRESEIEVKYIIDKNIDQVWADIDIYGLDETFPSVDVIVVTAFFSYEEIEDELLDRVTCPIVSIEDVVI